jgi:DNA-directed RNA polymerase subunit K/omega
MYPYMSRYERSALVGKRAQLLSDDFPAYITDVPRETGDERVIAEWELVEGELDGYLIFRPDPKATPADRKGIVIEVGALMLKPDGST